MSTVCVCVHKRRLCYVCGCADAEETLLGEFSSNQQ